MAVLLSALLIGAAGGYLALPWLAANYAADLAHPYGISIDALIIERPGWRTMHIDGLELRAGDLALSLSDADIDYRLADLLDGRLETLQIAQAAMTLGSTDAAAESDQAPDAETPPAPDIAAWFALVPFQRLEIAQLTAAIPELAFQAEGSLALDNRQLSFLLRGLSPQQAEDLSLEGTITADGGIRLMLASIQSAEQHAEEFLSIDSQLDDDRLTLTAAARLTGYPFQLAGVMAGLPAGKGTLQADVSTVLTWPFDEQDLAELSATGDFLLSWQSADADFRASGLAGQVEFAGDRVQARFSGGELKYQDETSTVTVNVPDGTMLSWAQRQLRISPGLVLSLLQTDLEVSGVSGELGVDLVAEPEVSAGLSADVQFAGYRQSGELTVDASVSDGELISGTGIWSTSGWQLPFQFRHQLDSAIGSGSAIGELRVNRPLAATLLDPWEAAYDLDSGTLGYNLNVHWAQQTTARLKLVLEGVSAHYEQELVSGISGELMLEVNGDQLSMAPAQLRAGTYDPGVLLSDLETTLALQDDRLSITDAGFRTLGGSVRISDFGYDMAAENSDISFEVQLEALDLAQLLALQGEDIAGTGRVSGVLPVRLRDQVPSVSGGQVASLPPGGVIALAPEFAGLSGQPGLDFAIKALTDYRFTSLAASVDYFEDGELKLGISLQGTNPEVEKGRPIHYNLNVTQNLLVLLQSLRAQRAVTDGLERRVLN